MHNVAKTELVFHETAFTPTRRNGQIWFMASDLARALQYANVKSITNLYNQNSDEFSQGMSQVIESVTSGNYRKKVRIFSLRGAHLLAMFARTPVAKEFRRWVLDILDREIFRDKQGISKMVICPCCNKVARVLEVKRLHRQCVEVIAVCRSAQCPTQPFRIDLKFSHYLEPESAETERECMKKLVSCLTSKQRQSLIGMLSKS
ncbi:Bro-N domain-containing protein [Pectobacterium odoriferum]|uniref:BRO-N domain-containing protein n=1 Tax=Pectobacterium odoriferum TaxID=78398 RepID=UPI0009B924FE|nr:Bro-N domain-containing protein [Pectobacterium odoriferum]